MKPLHAKTYQILTIILSVILLALIAKFFFGASTTQAEDGRQAIALDRAEIAHIRGDMRRFLSRVQQISQGIAEDDLTKVAEAATAVGTGNKHGAPVTLMAKLPPEFRKLGFGVHSQFDEIALKAQAGEKDQLLSLLSNTLKSCNSCHETFTVSLAK